MFFGIWLMETNPGVFPGGEAFSHLEYENTS